MTCETCDRLDAIQRTLDGLTGLAELDLEASVRAIARTEAAIAQAAAEVRNLRLDHAELTTE